jgi:hypothetical protein
MTQIVRKIWTVESLRSDVIMDRVETGALQINDDWPGLFIRGDSCIDLYNRLEYAKNLLMDTALPAPTGSALAHALSLAGICGLQQMIEDHVLVKPKEPPKA